MKRSYIPQTIALLLLLVILPMGSWFYLKSGFSYRKHAFAELGNFGKLDDIQLLQINNAAFKSDTNHVVLLQLDNSDQKAFENYEKIIKAYEQRNDVSSLKLTKDSTVTFPLVKAIMPVHTDEANLAKLNEVKNIIKAKKQHDINIILVNSKGVIVNGYDINTKDDMASLIKHVSILLPGNKKVDTAAVKREKEK